MQRLRFKTDDGSSFPDWKEKKLGNCTEFVKDGTHGTHKNVSNGHPLLSAKDIFDNVVHIPNDSRLISNDDYNKIFSKYNLQIGDVLITIVGTIGRTALVTDGCKHVAFQRSVGIIRPDKNIIDSEYLKIVCDVPHFQNELEVKKNKGAQAGVYLGVLSNIEIPVPSLPEQQKIAEFLSTIDTVIEKQKETVSAWEERKKGVMQKLFSQEVRFKADDGSEFSEWEEKKIGDVFSKVKDKNKDGQNQNVITNSAEFGLINQRDFFDKDIAIDGKTENYTVIKTGDFVYNPRKSKQAPYGPFNCYQLEEDGIVSPLYTCLRPKGNTDDEYLHWYFQSGSWYRFIYENGAQNGARHDRVGMTDSLMQEIPVYLPQAVEEQQKIADCLSALDEVIEKQKTTLAAWEEMKKGLLQQMFV